jgi:hypothetical protein
MTIKKTKANVATLASERAEKVNKIKIALRPENDVESIFAEEFAESRIHDDTLKRAAWRKIDTCMSGVLYRLLCCHQTSENDGALIQTIEDWATGDPLAKAVVATLLKKIGMTESDIEAAAMLEALPTIALIDQLQSSASVRRYRALAAIVGWRKHIGQLKSENHNAKRILDQSFDASQGAKDDL